MTPEERTQSLQTLRDIRALHEKATSIRAAQQAALERLKMFRVTGLDPARIEAYLRRKKLSDANRLRAHDALWALLFLREMERHVENGNAYRAALAALQAGIYCNDAQYGAGLATQATNRQSRGGKASGKKRRDPQLARARRLLLQWDRDDDLQEEYPVPATFLAKGMGLSVKQGKRWVEAARRDMN